jgi:hypothetical protein
MPTTPHFRRLFVVGAAVVAAAFMAGYASTAHAQARGPEPDPNGGIIIVCPGCPIYPGFPCNRCPIIFPCPPDPLLPPAPGMTPPPPPPTPTPGPAGLQTYRVCPQMTTAPPQAIQQMAIAEPYKFRGYGELRNPNVPYHPLFNTYRTWLSLTNFSVPYSRCNPAIWKAGCP